MGIKTVYFFERKKPIEKIEHWKKACNKFKIVKKQNSDFFKYLWFETVRFFYPRASEKWPSQIIALSCG